MNANFLLGTIKMTDDAKRALQRRPYDLLARHAINEHGCITPKERRKNLQGMATLGPILSRYRIDPTDPQAGSVVVLTTDSWESTVVYLEPKTRIKH